MGSACLNESTTPSERVSIICRRRHFSFRTEEAYIHWIKRFIFFHQKRDPDSMGIPEVESFLNYLAYHRSCSASTQTQALNALVFLYQEVLEAFRTNEGLESCTATSSCASGVDCVRS